MDDAAIVRHHDTSADTNAYVRRISGDVCLVGFSGGKDAIASWLRLRDFFPRIVPFYRYLIPGLEFVEEGLAEHERAFGEKIIRVPHASLPRMLRELVFQAPEQCLAIEKAKLPSLSYEHTNDHVRRIADAPGAYVAVGTRASDSGLRAARIRIHGSVNPKAQSFLPIWDWRLADVVDAIKKARMRLPVDYLLFGSSFDGIDYKYLAPIKRHHPRDYARILEWFPLADLELFRRGDRGDDMRRMTYGR